MVPVLDQRKRSPGASRSFLDELRGLLASLRLHKVPAHFPVESFAKAQFYHEELGHLVTVRESLQRPTDPNEGPCAMVAGAHITTGRNIRRRRYAAAQRVATERRAMSVRRVVICPAILASWFRTDHKARPIQCGGSCKACANPAVDVIYPAH